MTLPSATLEKLIEGIRQTTDAGSITIEQAMADDAEVWLAGGDTEIGDFVNRLLGKKANAQLRPSGKPQRLAKPCGEQFARKVLASCVVDKDLAADGGAIGLSLAVRYYQPPTDKTAAACIAAGASWDELPHDSLEYRHAVHEQQYKRLRRSLGQ